jgi:hypothetical protein
MKKHHPVHNLGKWAHPPKAEQNHPTRTASTQSNTMKLMGKVSKATGKRGKA